MKRVLTISVLVIIIVLSFGFVILKVLAAGNDQSSFNRKIRPMLAAQPGLRQILSLHYDGDGRADYLGKRYKKILIEVDLATATTIRLAALDLLKTRIEEVTGKETTYIISDREMPYYRELSKEKIVKLALKYRNYHQTRDTATLYLMSLPKFTEQPTRLGMTHQEYGIVLFGEALADFTEDSPNTLINYEVSTALHEFGHQLGLPHNQEPGCLMNERAEIAHGALENPEDVITDFCEYEKRLL